MHPEAAHYAGLYGPGTRQIAFAAASSGERAPSSARIDLGMAFLVAERGEHPHSAGYEHHNEHDGHDDQDKLDHNRICSAVRALAPSALRFSSTRSCALPALHRLYRWNATECREAVDQLRIVGSKLVLDGVENPLLVVSQAHICVPPPPGLFAGRPLRWRSDSAASRYERLPPIPPEDRRAAYTELAAKGRRRSSLRSTNSRRPATMQARRRALSRGRLNPGHESR